MYRENAGQEAVCVCMCVGLQQLRRSTAIITNSQISFLQFTDFHSRLLICKQQWTLTQNLFSTHVQSSHCDSMYSIVDEQKGVEPNYTHVPVNYLDQYF